jgi:hypothetical protein
MRLRCIEDVKAHFKVAVLQPLRIPLASRDRRSAPVERFAESFETADRSFRPPGSISRTLHSAGFSTSGSANSAQIYKKIEAV